MNKKTAIKYLKTRSKINQCADNIYAISKLMKVFSDFPMGKESKIDFSALGKIGELIYHDTFNIIQSLDDDFVHPMDVKDKLSKGQP